MSFVNLLANDVWSDADITNRTEAMLHSEVSTQDELILSRKMIGYSLGLIIPSSDEAAQLTTYQTAAYLSQAAGIAARADMALLQTALDYERAQARLAVPVNPDLATDADERAAATACIAAAGAETLALVALRAYFAQRDRLFRSIVTAV